MKEENYFDDLFRGNPERIFLLVAPCGISAELDDETTKAVMEYVH